MRATTSEDYKQRILRVLVHIQRNLDRELGLDELADLAAFSRYHFHRVFRGMVGETLNDHVRRLRLERAAMRLKQSDRPVTRIALDSGYDSHEAFTRAFRAMFGTTPSGFREGQSAPRPEAPSGVHYDAGGEVARFEPWQRREETMEIELCSVPERRVVFVRHVGPYSGCGPAWERLLAWAGAEGYLGAGVTMLGLCHDDPDVTDEDKIRYDACVTVDDDIEPRGEIGVQIVAGGEYARTTHQGPYAELRRTYDRLFGEWLPRSGREARSTPCFEVYLNDPGSTEPEELLTDVFLALEPR